MIHLLVNTMKAHGPRVTCTLLMSRHTAPTAAEATVHAVEVSNNDWKDDGRETLFSYPFLLFCRNKKTKERKKEIYH
jgi:hypothetical protein